MVQIYAGLDLVSFSKNAFYNCNQFPKKLLKTPISSSSTWLFLFTSYVGLCLGAMQKALPWHSLSPFLRQLSTSSWQIALNNFLGHCSSWPDKSKPGCDLLYLQFDRKLLYLFLFSAGFFCLFVF